MGGQTFPQTKIINNILLLFFGPRNAPDSLKEELDGSGLQVEDYDLVNGVEFDIADDVVWGQILGQLEAGHFAALVASPPCGSCSRVRQVPGGPPVFRGIDGPCRYGLADLTPKQKEVVRVSNLLAVRTAEAFCIILKQGRVGIIE